MSAESISGNQFNPYENLGKVKVTKWGTTNEQGERLDCYWNIAKNKLDVGATDAEILDTMSEIMRLNASKDSSGDYSPMLYENQEILLDLKSTMNQAQDAMDSSMQQFQLSASNLQNIQGIHSQIVKEMNDEKTSYDESIKNGDSDASKRFLEQYNQKKQILEEVEANLQKAKTKFDASKQDVAQLKEILGNLQGEYENKDCCDDNLEAEFQNKINEFQGQVDSIESSITALDEQKMVPEELVQKEIEDKPVKDEKVEQESKEEPAKAEVKDEPKAEVQQQSNQTPVQTEAKDEVKEEPAKAEVKDEAKTEAQDEVQQQPNQIVVQNEILNKTVINEVKDDKSDVSAKDTAITQQKTFNNGEQISQSEHKFAQSLRNELKQQMDEQGTIANFVNKLKNLTGIGSNSKKCEQAIKDFEDGKISYTEAQSIIKEFSKKQDTATIVAPGIMQAALTPIGAGIALIASAIDDAQKKNEEERKTVLKEEDKNSNNFQEELERFEQIKNPDSTNANQNNERPPEIEKLRERLNIQEIKKQD